MKTKQTDTCQITIFTSGPVERIKDVCREYCLVVGLCVTVTETAFIYTGGEESGVMIGLVNYPRFPVPEKELFQTAVELSGKILDHAYQHSILIVSPDKTKWISRRS